MSTVQCSSQCYNVVLNPLPLFKYLYFYLKKKKKPAGEQWSSEMLDVATVMPPTG